MRRINLLKTSLVALSLGLSAISCGSDNTDIFETPEDPIEDPTGVTQSAEINIAFDSNLPEGEQRTGKFFALATGQAGGKVNGRVQFTSDRDMRRLYITRTLPGGEPEPFASFDELDSKSIRKATKPDGSIDLDGDRKNAFDFTFELDVPANATDGETIYNFWATSGRGDFTDPSKRLLVGVGTIEVKIGTATIGQQIISQEGISLRAPLGDGSSETFVSLFNLNEPFRIDEGAGTSELWDFGYFFGNTSRASLASANNYPSNIIDIVTISNQDRPADEEEVMASDLRMVYFKRNTTIDFDTVSLAELGALTVSSSDSQRVTQLEANQVVEFLDSTGRKGLIRIVSITGTDGSSGTIVLDVKSTPSAPIMNGDTF